MFALQVVCRSPYTKERFSYFYTLCFLQAMHFIHISELKVHGNLKSSNCVVDSRFVLKVTDFGLRTLRDNNDDIEDHYAYWKRECIYYINFA